MGVGVGDEVLERLRLIECPPRPLSGLLLVASELGGAAGTSSGLDNGSGLCLLLLLLLSFLMRDIAESFLLTASKGNSLLNPDKRLADPPGLDVSLGGPDFSLALPVILSSHVGEAALLLDFELAV